MVCANHGDGQERGEQRMHKYEDILQRLSKQIAELEPGTQIPTEKELAARFSASTMTVRRALQILIENGRLRGVPGKGTFVAHPRVTKMMSSASSFTDAMRLSGRVPGSRLIEAMMRSCEPDEATWFDIDLGSRVYVIRRVRLGDSVALGYEVATLVAAQLPGLLACNLEESLYDILAKQYGLTIVRESIVVSARCPTKQEAEHLGIEPQLPCLRTVVTSSDGTGSPLEHTVSLFRGDMYEVSA